jgi:hypothetical protein
MTDFSVFTRQFQGEDRSWDLTPPEGAFYIGGTLDLSGFNAAQHWPNGYIKAGLVLGKVTATNKFVPYLSTLGNGAQTAACILWASVQVVRADGSLPTAIGFAGIVHGKVDDTKLPYTSGNAAAGGYIDAAAKTALKLIYFGAN